jgi:hypothetical protein
MHRSGSQGAFLGTFPKYTSIRNFRNMLFNWLIYLKNSVFLWHYRYSSYTLMHFVAGKQNSQRNGMKITVIGKKTFVKPEKSSHKKAAVTGF